MFKTVRRLPLSLLVLGVVPAMVPAVPAQGFDDVVIVEPLPAEELFVDPVRDTLDPALAAIDPREAEIEPWRLGILPHEAPLAPARSRVRVAEARATSSLFVDPTRRENELTAVERVAESGREVRVDRFARRVSSESLAATRRARFGRSEVSATRPPFDASRPYGPRP